MNDYTKWPLKLMSVTSLHLDPENPRIPFSGNHLSQRQLIEELVEHDKVFELARSIAKNGYFPNEVIVCFLEKSDGKRYVVEGNRRLAALKCLLSPDAAPEAFQKKFEQLSNLIDSNTISKVYVLNAPNRQAAIPLLLDRHTHEQIQSWSRPMQAQFLRSLFDQEMSLEQIAAWSGKTVADVRKLLDADILYSAACRLTLSNEVAEKVTNPRTFPLTNLERMLDSKKVCEFLGVEKDAAKGFKGKVSKDEFAKGFGRIVADVATGKINSRSSNTASDIKKYLDKISDCKPDQSKRGTLDLSKFAAKETKTKSTIKKSSPKKKTRRPSSSVIPVVFKCSCESNRIQDVFNELKRLSIEKHPNATAILLRTLIDLCVSNYLEKTGEMKKILAKFRAKQNKPRGWSPSLHQMLSHLLNEMDCGLEGAAHTALETFNSARKEVMCLDGLDKFTHNKYLPPEPSALRSIWTIVEPLMEIILVDPE